MKLNIQFPEQDFSEVEIPKRGKIQVRFRYPSYNQIQRMGLGDYALAICKYSVAEVTGIEDAEGAPYPIKAVEVRGEFELSDKDVATLFNNDLHNSIALYYQLHAAVTEIDKKK